MSSAREFLESQFTEGPEDTKRKNREGVLKQLKKHSNPSLKGSRETLIKRIEIQASVIRAAYNVFKGA